MTGTDLQPHAPLAGTHTSVDVVGLLREALAEADRHLPKLAGDQQALAAGHLEVEQLRRDLLLLLDRIDAMLLDTLDGERRVDIDGVGRVERYAPKPRARWDSEGLLAALIRQALDPDGTGELPASPLDAVQQVVEVLVECMPVTASLAWRRTPLRARGLVAGGQPVVLDECDDDGSQRLADKAGYLSFSQAADRLRFSSLEGVKR